jgi:pyruvyltransferase
MNVHWMRCINFGDQLNEYLYTKILKKEIRYSCDMSIPYYVSIGSLFGDEFINENAIVCGIGIANKNDTFIRPKKTYLVRGKCTQTRYKELGYECPDIVGDPGLILPLYYNPNFEKIYNIGYTPHIIDTDSVKKLLPNTETSIVIDLRCCNNIEDVINQMLQCRYVVSSSLHGLVIAHAYNIPCLWVRSIKPLCGDGSKFLDYYSAFDIYNICPMDSVDKIQIQDIATYPQPNSEKLREIQTNINIMFTSLFTNNHSLTNSID